MSTTASRNVAVRYSGAAQGKPQAAVLVLRVGAVDRPASLEAYSQYPGEKESLFAPLTFLAGIYGMNFEFMPELKWSYGYPACLVVMALIATVQATWLWRRGWFVDWTGTRPRR